MLRTVLMTVWRANLIERKQALLRGDASLVCVGNSGGDLDTLVSALAAAHLLNGVAVAPFPARDFALRRDAARLFAHCGFDFRDDGSVPEFLYADEVPKRSLDVALVDHNVLDSALLPEARVAAIFDHHADEGLYEDASPRVVDPGCGSACTLLAERLEDAPSDLLALLVCTVVLDTRGFRPKKLKFSDRDVAAARKTLDTLLGSTTVEPLKDRAVSGLAAVGGAKTVKELADVLGDARHDVSDLTARQLLRMDYKQGAAGPLRLGCAGVLVDLYTLRARAHAEGAGLADLLAELRDERNLDYVVAMCAKSECDPLDGRQLGDKRKALVYLPRDTHLERAIEAVPDGLPADLADLPLFQAQSINLEGFRAAFGNLDELRFSFIAPQVTRKTLLPTLLRFIRK